MSGISGFKGGPSDPFLAPDAPTVDSVTPGLLTASVAFTAPADTGGGAISSYVVSAKQSDGTSVSTTGSSSPLSVTLTAGGTTTFAVQAFNAYGAGQFSGYGNSSTVYTGQTLYTWGRNSNGQLGLNNLTDSSSPVQVGALATWAQVSTSLSFGIGERTAAIKTDGTLWAWGENNSNGSLGDNTNVNRSSPVQIGSLTNWNNVDVGGMHTAAVKTDNTLWTWGLNDHGQLGQSISTLTKKSSPVQVGSLTDWSLAACGYSHAAAIKTDGTLWTWGRNHKGQLGIDTTASRSSPVQVGALTNWSKVSAGTYHVMAVKTDGTLWAWGEGGNGRLGTGNTDLVSSPVQIGALTNWSIVACGYRACGAVKTDNTLWMWGLSNWGQLGQNNTVTKSSPVQVGASTDWAQISTADTHTAAVKTDGTLWTWGNDADGRLGQNDGIARSSPTQVGASTGWIAVSTGYFQAAAIFGSTS